MLFGGGDKLDITSYYSPRNRERPKRKSTEFIILHTTEGPKTGSLKKVYENGETHYFIDEAGKIYRIINELRVAYHAGRSMWNGKTDLDYYSIGIELVGYHNKSITSAQKTALKGLIEKLQKAYRVPDDRVIPHSMVAYGTPNRWHKKSHRGRKRCGMLFANRSLRLQIGLEKQPLYDPDVRAGRLTVGDKYLEKALYGTAKEQEQATAYYSNADANVIAPGRSAWDIARNLYNHPETTYIFPDGKKMQGNEIKNWTKIQAGTKVILPLAQDENEREGVLVIGVDGNTAIDIAGDEYKNSTTFYFFPDKSFKSGNKMSDANFKSMPDKTKVLVGYALMGTVTAKKSAFDLCKEKWKFPSTFYFSPDGQLTAGDMINEKAISSGTCVFCRN